MFSGPSSYTGTVDFVMFYIVTISVILLVGITAVMIYFVFKYNRKKGHKPVDIHSNIWLETIWIVIPTILVLTMFYYGYIGFEEARIQPKDAFNVDVTGRMWQWSFTYSNGKKADSLFVPVDEPILLNLESKDVNHSFFIPAFRIKEDVIAGSENYMYFKPSKVGSYTVECAEYCGLNHSNMYSQVVVMPRDKFEKWYGEKLPPLKESKSLEE
jgi:cytochrome c oxidase subunit 2